MSPITNRDWQDILTDLKKNRVVLLIGPEIKTATGDLLSQALHQHLTDIQPSFITYYYERDGIYLFKNKMKAQRATGEFYEDVALDERLLQQIVQIPFDLILSINPDTVIADAFHRYSVPRDFYFFQHGGQANDDNLNEPSIKKPVVYNLFGLKEQDESFVLDYNDLYKMLKSLLGSPGLPAKLSKKLRDARTYIFIGFQFDKWYAQLLLKLLQDDSTNDKILSLNGALKDTATHDFMISQFEIQFLDPQFSFLENLYQHCQEAKILRGVSEANNTPEGERMRQFIADANHSAALEALREATKGNKETENEVIALQSRLSQLNKELNDGILPSSEYHAELNKIVNALIEFVNTLYP
jgi:Effector-associated domain 11/SIR2-like domain